jgi:Short C-terminal domain
MVSGNNQPAEDELGPIDFLAVEFPDGRISASGFEELLSLVRQGTIRVLDAELKNAGILTDAEFEQQKARILNG